MNKWAFGVASLLVLQSPVSGVINAKEKESSIKKMEQRVQEWSAKAEALQKRSEKAGRRTRAEIDSDLKAVQKELGAMQKNLSALKGSNGGTWTRFRHWVDRIIEGIKRIYQKARAGLTAQVGH